MEKGHWYTDKNGNHYFVENGQSPKEGWERSKRRKMIDGGKYKVDDGDGKGPREVSREEWGKYEADDDFDATTDDDFGFDNDEAGDAGVDQAKLASRFEMSDEEAEDFADFLYNKGLRDGDEDQAINFYEEWATKNNKAAKTQDARKRFLKEKGLDAKYELDKNGYLIDKEDGMAVLNFGELDDDFDEVMHQISFYEGMEKGGVPKENTLHSAYGYEAEDFGNMRTFPNKTGSPMTKDNKWIGSHYSIEEAHSGNDTNLDNFNKRFKPAGKSKLGQDIFQGPDGYYSLNPRVYGESFKSIDDLEDYYGNEGRADFGKPGDYKSRYDAYSKRKGIVDKKSDASKTEEADVDERKINHIEEYFNIWGRPSEREFPDVIKHYGLNEKEAAELKKRLRNK